MSAINPFSGYVAQGSQVERTQADDKSRQVKREQALSKSVAAQDDQLEHQVESADAIVSIHDDGGQQQQNPSQQQRRQPAQPDEGGDGELPRLDVTA
ncbi:MAG TPA: hypothetical protein VH475_09100 [Tepidisphaeraceae bacterium]